LISGPHLVPATIEKAVIETVYGLLIDERYCQMLWVGSSSGRDALGVGLVGLAPFLWSAVDEDGSGSDQGYQMVSVDPSPSGLGSIGEFVGHGQSGPSAAGALGDLGT
jgi:hypothetical protein